MSKESQIRVESYEPKYKALWDDFVRQSKNGVFLFHRDYMEYHADRFDDFSLLFFEGERLIALMPASHAGETVVSHGGLTFGGIVSGADMTVDRMLAVFSALVDELRSQGVRKLVYKAIPHMYHLLPAEEDLYALFVHGARLVRRDVSSTIVAGHRPPLVRSRRKSSRAALAHGVRVVRSHDFAQFMAIASDSLQTRHGVAPIHSAAEMRMLAERFPENIKLYAALQQEEMLAGVILYESANVAHGQYRNATPEGMKMAAVDCLLDALVNDIYPHKPFLDFGTSMLNGGSELNADLVRNKESFGARTTVYDSYELDLKASSTRLNSK